MAIKFDLCRRNLPLCNILLPSDDVVLRKDVHFVGPENKILHFDPFPPKTQIFGQFLTGQKISRQKGLNNGDARL